MKTENRKQKLNLLATIVLMLFGLMVQANVYAASTAEIPANHQPKKPSYITANASKVLAPALAAVGSPVVRVYQDFVPWFGEGRDQATLLALGLELGNNYFVHPLSDLAAGIPADTTVVLITSNSFDFVGPASAENDPVAQANLDVFVQAGGTLIVDMADNLDQGGFIAPGAQGTPTYFVLPDPPGDATLATAALGTDALLGTDDDHPIIKGPDGIAGTSDDLNNSNIDYVDGFRYVAIGNLIDGITLQESSTILMTASFGGTQKPILAEYVYGNGKIILDTIPKEYEGHKPFGTGPSFFMLNLFHYALQLPPPTPPANDDFDNAIAIVEPLPYTNDQNTLFATTANDDPDCFGNVAAVWYQYTPSQNTRIRASTVGSNYDTTLSIYSGSRGNLNQLVCNDNAIGFQSEAFVNVIAGTTYYLAVGTHPEQLGGHLHFTLESGLPPVNDLIGAATIVTEPLPFVDVVDTRFATAEANDPGDCFGIIPTVWYQYTPTKNTRFVANTSGSDYPAAVSVYTGTPSNLSLISCGGGIDAIAGTTYYFGISSFSGAGGNLRFSVELGLQVTLSNIKGSATKTGVATISGLVTCNKPASGSLLVNLQQTFIRSTAQGGNSTFMDCLGATPWSIPVTSFTSTRFGTGQANVTIDGSFFDPVTFDNPSVHVIKKIPLNGNK